MKHTELDKKESKEKTPRNPPDSFDSNRKSFPSVASFDILERLLERKISKEDGGEMKDEERTETES